MKSANYRIVNIRSSSQERDPEAAILVIYTGGTIGMIHDDDGSLVPFNFGKIVDHIPELQNLELRLTVISFPKPIDSSNINADDWQSLAFIIYENYDQYDGFVILHGTDTMAYSASALSYILDGLNKPVIFTGAQIPIGNLRSDARENFITALEIASAKSQGIPRVREVCIYFNYLLLRGNRSQKVRSSTFAAFESQNYPVLAEAGISIEYMESSMMPYRTREISISRNKFNSHVTILKLFPGIPREIIQNTLAMDGLRGVVLETFGSGNTMNFSWFLTLMKDAIARGIIIFNVSQCSGGEVIQGRYETSKKLKEIGVIGGRDITTEAAVTKLMFLLGNESDNDSVRKKLAIPLKGEMDL